MVSTGTRATSLGVVVIILAILAPPAAPQAAPCSDTCAGTVTVGILVGSCVAVLVGTILVELAILLCYRHCCKKNLTPSNSDFSEEGLTQPKDYHAASWSYRGSKAKKSEVFNISETKEDKVMFSPGLYHTSLSPNGKVKVNALMQEADNYTSEFPTTYSYNSGWDHRVDHILGKHGNYDRDDASMVSIDLNDDQEYPILKAPKDSLGSVNFSSAKFGIHNHGFQSHTSDNVSLNDSENSDVCNFRYITGVGGKMRPEVATVSALDYDEQQQRLKGNLVTQDNTSVIDMEWDNFIEPDTRISIDDNFMIGPPSISTTESTNDSQQDGISVDYTGNFILRKTAPIRSDSSDEDLYDYGDSDIERKQLNEKHGEWNGYFSRATYKAKMGTVTLERDTPTDETQMPDLGSRFRYSTGLRRAKHLAMRAAAAPTSRHNDQIKERENTLLYQSGSPEQALGYIKLVRPDFNERLPIPEPVHREAAPVLGHIRLTRPDVFAKTMSDDQQFRLAPVPGSTDESDDLMVLYPISSKDTTCKRCRGEQTDREINSNRAGIQLPNALSLSNMEIKTSGNDRDGLQTIGIIQLLQPYDTSTVSSTMSKKQVRFKDQPNTHLSSNSLQTTSADHYNSVSTTDDETESRRSLVRQTSRSSKRGSGERRRKRSKSAPPVRGPQREVETKLPTIGVIRLVSTESIADENGVLSSDQGYISPTPAGELSEDRPTYDRDSVGTADVGTIGILKLVKPTGQMPIRLERSRKTNISTERKKMPDRTVGIIHLISPKAKRKLNTKDAITEPHVPWNKLLHTLKECVEEEVSKKYSKRGALKDVGKIKLTRPEGLLKDSGTQPDKTWFEVMQDVEEIVDDKYRKTRGPANEDKCLEPRVNNVGVIRLSTPVSRKTIQDRGTQPDFSWRQMMSEFEDEIKSTLRLQQQQPAQAVIKLKQDAVKNLRPVVALTKSRASQSQLSWGQLVRKIQNDATEESRRKVMRDHQLMEANKKKDPLVSIVKLKGTKDQPKADSCTQSDHLQTEEQTTEPDRSWNVILTDMKQILENEYIRTIHELESKLAYDTKDKSDFGQTNPTVAVFKLKSGPKAPNPRAVTAFTQCETAQTTDQDTQPNRSWSNVVTDVREILENEYRRTIKELEYKWSEPENKTTPNVAVFKLKGTKDRPKTNSFTQIDSIKTEEQTTQPDRSWDAILTDMKQILENDYRRTIHELETKLTDKPKDEPDFGETTPTVAVFKLKSSPKTPPPLAVTAFTQCETVQTTDQDTQPDRSWSNVVTDVRDILDNEYRRTIKELECKLSEAKKQTAPSVAVLKLKGTKDRPKADSYTQIDHIQTDEQTTQPDRSWDAILTDMKQILENDYRRTIHELETKLVDKPNVESDSGKTNPTVAVFKLKSGQKTPTPQGVAAFTQCEIARTTNQGTQPDRSWSNVVTDVREILENEYRRKIKELECRWHKPENHTTPSVAVFKLKGTNDRPKADSYTQIDHIQTEEQTTQPDRSWDAILTDMKQILENDYRRTIHELETKLADKPKVESDFGKTAPTVAVLKLKSGQKTPTPQAVAAFTQCEIAQTTNQYTQPDRSWSNVVTDVREILEKEYHRKIKELEYRLSEPEKKTIPTVSVIKLKESKKSIVNQHESGTQAAQPWGEIIASVREAVENEYRQIIRDLQCQLAMPKDEPRTKSLGIFKLRRSKTRKVSTKQSLQEKSTGPMFPWSTVVKNVEDTIERRLRNQHSSQKAIQELQVTKQLGVITLKSPDVSARLMLDTTDVEREYIERSTSPAEVWPEALGKAVGIQVDEQVPTKADFGMMFTPYMKETGMSTIQTKLVDQQSQVINHAKTESGIQVRPDYIDFTNQTRPEVRNAFTSPARTSTLSLSPIKIISKVSETNGPIQEFVTYQTSEPLYAPIILSIPTVERYTQMDKILTVDSMSQCEYNQNTVNIQVQPTTRHQNTETINKKLQTVAVQSEPLFQNTSQMQAMSSVSDGHTMTLDNNMTDTGTNTENWPTEWKQTQVSPAVQTRGMFTEAPSGLIASTQTVLNVLNTWTQYEKEYHVDNWVQVATVQRNSVTQTDLKITNNQLEIIPNMIEDIKASRNSYMYDSDSGVDTNTQTEPIIVCDSSSDTDVEVIDSISQTEPGVFFTESGYSEDENELVNVNTRAIEVQPVASEVVRKVNMVEFEMAPIHFTPLTVDADAQTNIDVKTIYAQTKTVQVKDQAVDVVVTTQLAQTQTYDPKKNIMERHSQTKAIDKIHQSSSTDLAKKSFAFVQTEVNPVVNRSSSPIHIPDMRTKIDVKTVYAQTTVINVEDRAVNVAAITHLAQTQTNASKKNITERHSQTMDIEQIHQSSSTDTVHKSFALVQTEVKPVVDRPSSPIPIPVIHRAASPIQARVVHRASSPIHRQFVHRANSPILAPSNELAVQATWITKDVFTQHEDNIQLHEEPNMKDQYTETLPVWGVDFTAQVHPLTIDQTTVTDIVTMVTSEVQVEIDEMKARTQDSGVQLQPIVRTLNTGVQVEPMRFNQATNTIPAPRASIGVQFSTPMQKPCMISQEISETSDKCTSTRILLSENMTQTEVPKSEVGVQMTPDITVMSVSSSAKPEMIDRCSTILPEVADIIVQVTPVQKDEGTQSDKPSLVDMPSQYERLESEDTSVQVKPVIREQATSPIVKRKNMSAAIQTDPIEERMMESFIDKELVHKAELVSVMSAHNSSPFADQATSAVLSENNATFVDDIGVQCKISVRDSSAQVMPISIHKGTETTNDSQPKSTQVKPSTHDRSTFILPTSNYNRTTQTQVETIVRSTSPLFIYKTDVGIQYDIPRPIIVEPIIQPVEMSKIHAFVPPSYEDFENLHIREELKKELREEIRTEVIEEIREDMKEAVSMEIERDVRDIFKREMEDEIRNEITTTIREELIEDVREEYESSIKYEIEDRYREDFEFRVRQDLEPSIRLELQPIIRKEVEKDLHDHIPPKPIFFDQGTSPVKDAVFSKQTQTSVTTVTRSTNFEKLLAKNAMTQVHPCTFDRGTTPRENMTKPISVQASIPMVDKMVQFELENAMNMLPVEVIEKIREEIREDIADDVRTEIERDLREIVRREMGDEVRDEMTTTIREELIKDVREELTVEFESRIRFEMEDRHREDIEFKVRRDLEPIIRSEMQSIIQNEVEKDLRNQKPPIPICVDQETSPVKYVIFSKPTQTTVTTITRGTNVENTPTINAMTQIQPSTFDRGTTPRETVLKHISVQATIPMVDKVVQFELEPAMKSVAVEIKTSLGGPSSNDSCVQTEVDKRNVASQVTANQKVSFTQYEPLYYVDRTLQVQPIMVNQSTSVDPIHSRELPRNTNQLVGDSYEQTGSFVQHEVEHQGIQICPVTRDEASSPLSSPYSRNQATSPFVQLEADVPGLDKLRTNRPVTLRLGTKKFTDNTPFAVEEQIQPIERDPVFQSRHTLHAKQLHLKTKDQKIDLSVPTQNISHLDYSLHEPESLNYTDRTLQVQPVVDNRSARMSPLHSKELQRTHTANTKTLVDGFTEHELDVEVNNQLAQTSSVMCNKVSRDQTTSSFNPPEADYTPPGLGKLPANRPVPLKLGTKKSTDKNSLLDEEEIQPIGTDHLFQNRHTLQSKGHLPKSDTFEIDSSTVNGALSPTTQDLFSRLDYSLRASSSSFPAARSDHSKPYTYTYTRYDDRPAQAKKSLTLRLDRDSKIGSPCPQSASIPTTIAHHHSSMSHISTSTIGQRDTLLPQTAIIVVHTTSSGSKYTTAICNTTPTTKTSVALSRPSYFTNLSPILSSSSSISDDNSSVGVDELEQIRRDLRLSQVIITDDPVTLVNALSNRVDFPSQRKITRLHRSRPISTTLSILFKDTSRTHLNPMTPTSISFHDPKKSLFKTQTSASQWLTHKTTSYKMNVSHDSKGSPRPGTKLSPPRPTSPVSPRITPEEIARLPIPRGMITRLSDLMDVNKKNNHEHTKDYSLSLESNADLPVGPPIFDHSVRDLATFFDSYEAIDKFFSSGENVGTSDSEPDTIDSDTDSEHWQAVLDLTNSYLYDDTHYLSDETGRQSPLSEDSLSEDDNLSVCCTYDLLYTDLPQVVPASSDDEHHTPCEPLKKQRPRAQIDSKKVRSELELTEVILSKSKNVKLTGYTHNKAERIGLLDTFPYSLYNSLGNRGRTRSEPDIMSAIRDEGSIPGSPTPSLASSQTSERLNEKPAMTAKGKMLDAEFVPASLDRVRYASLVGKKRIFMDNRPQFGRFAQLSQSVPDLAAEDSKHSGVQMGRF